MKGIIKAVIAGAIIIGIGLVFLLVGLSLTGWSVGIKEFEMNRYEATEENTSLEVDFGAGKLKTVFYDGEKIAVDYPTANGYTTEIKEKNGKLSLKTKVTVFSFGGIKWEIPDTTIYLPKDIVFDLDLDLGAGTMSVESGTYGKVEIDVGAGEFILGDTVCSSFDAKISAGLLTVKSLVCGEFDAKVSAGKFEVNTLECRKVDAKVSAGKLEITSLTCPELDLKISAGSIVIRVDGAKREYNISTSVSAGSCNLSDQPGSTDKKIDAKVSAGSINIFFTE